MAHVSGPPSSFGEPVTDEYDSVADSPDQNAGVLPRSCRTGKQLFEPHRLFKIVRQISLSGKKQIFPFPG
jgi:hypothetical protein